MYSLALIFILQYFLKELYGLGDNVNEKEKEKVALRFGFHQTYACQNFEKAYKCIRKCLDEKFDVAYSDKNCACTCYNKKEKEKYKYSEWQDKGKPPPTTKLPVWAQPKVPIPIEESEEPANPLAAVVGAEERNTTLPGDDSNGKNDGNATLDANAETATSKSAEGDGGEDGEHGEDGEPGEDGEHGENGENGENGEHGEEGENGEQGEEPAAE